MTKTLMKGRDPVFVGQYPPTVFSTVCVLSASIYQRSLPGHSGEINAAIEQNGGTAVEWDFTYSIGGWDSENYLAALPNIISKYAGVESETLILFHGFGNNISPDGPWPGGSATYQRDMRTIMTRLLDAGFKVLSSSVSYRLEGFSNPSVMYSTQVNEPLIRELTPEAWDYWKNRPIIDLYKLTRDEAPAYHVEDGVHPNTIGQHRIRAEVAKGIAERQAGVYRDSLATDYSDKTVLVSTWQTSGVFTEGINTSIHEDLGNSAGEGMRGSSIARTIRSTDGEILHGAIFECFNYQNRNTAGRGGDSSTSLANSNILSGSIYADPENLSTNTPVFARLKGLPNGLTGKVRVTASRSTTANDRKGSYTLVSTGETKTLDASSSPAEVIEFDFKVINNEVRIDLQLLDDQQSFAYLSGLEYIFDRFEGKIDDTSRGSGVLKDGDEGYDLDFSTLSYEAGDLVRRVVINGHLFAPNQGDNAGTYQEDGSILFEGSPQALVNADTVEAFREYPFTLAMVCKGDAGYMSLTGNAVRYYGIQHRANDSERAFTRNTSFVGVDADANSDANIKGFILATFEESGVTFYAGDTVTTTSSQPAPGDLKAVAIGGLVDSTPGYSENLNVYGFLAINRAVTAEEVAQFRSYYNV